MKKVKNVVWTIRDDGGGDDGGREVVFADKDKAELVSKIYNACENSKTWGAFKKQMPPAEYKKILAEFMEDNPKPKQDDPFDARECVPRYADGDYPDWLQQEMLEWFPNELVSKCSASKESVHNGEFVSLPADKAEAIAERLREMGYTVQHRPDLTFY